MKSIYGMAALLGAASGIRSMAGFAILTTSDAPPRGSPFRSPVVRGAATAALAGEALADKLAHLPARTQPFPLVGRMALGGAAAGIAARWSGRDPVASVLIGAGTAATTAWAATALRRAVKRHQLPDAWPALAEDAAVMALGRAAIAESRLPASR